MIYYCRECGHELTDVNEGYYRLRYGYPEMECTNRDCPLCPDYIPEESRAPVIEDELVEA